MTGALHVGVGQSSGGLDGPEARLAWVTALLERHHGPKLDLLVLPELFQCGYNIGDTVPNRAEAPDGPFAQAIATLAQRSGTAILYGYAERQGDHLFNAAQCIDATGATIAHHRKLLLPPGFEGDHFEPGSDCTMFRLGSFKLAILVCYDVEFPETLRHVALAGADAVLVPTALGAQWGVVSECVVPTRAFENGVFVCYANHCDQENDLAYFGGSCIIAPDGTQLARAGTTPELIHARLELSAVAAAQTRLPYLKDRQKLSWVRF